MKKHKTRTYQSRIINEFFKLGDERFLEFEKVAAKMIIAAKIDEAMKTAKIGKKQLADKMKLSPSIVTRWLSGDHNFTVETLVELEYVLKTKLI